MALKHKRTGEYIKIKDVHIEKRAIECQIYDSTEHRNPTMNESLVKQPGTKIIRGFIDAEFDAAFVTNKADPLFSIKENELKEGYKMLKGLKGESDVLIFKDYEDV